jgi:hypothetical protein
MTKEEKKNERTGTGVLANCPTRKSLLPLSQEGTGRRCPEAGSGLER